MANSKALPTHEYILASDYSKVSKKLKEKKVKIGGEYEGTVKKTKSPNTSDVAGDEWAEGYWDNVAIAFKKEFSKEAWKEWGKGALNDLLSLANTASTNFVNNLKKAAVDWMNGGGKASVEDLKKSLDKGIKIDANQEHHIEDVISAGKDGDKGREYYKENIAEDEDKTSFLKENLNEIENLPENSWQLSEKNAEDYQKAIKDKETTEPHNKSEKDWSQIGVDNGSKKGFEQLDKVLDGWLKNSGSSFPDIKTSWKHSDKHWSFDEKTEEDFVKTSISKGTLESSEVFKAKDTKLAEQMKDKTEVSWSNNITLNSSDEAGKVFAKIMVGASFEKSHDFNVHLANETSDFLKQLSLSLRGVQFGNKQKWKPTSMRVGGKDLEVATSSQESSEKKGEFTLFERPDMRFFKWAIKKIGLTKDNLDLAPSIPFNMIVYRPTVGDEKGLESYNFEDVRLYDISGLEGNNSKDLVKYLVKFIYRNVTKTTN